MLRWGTQIACSLILGAAVGALLETARVEVEAAGPGLEPGFVGLFVGGCARLDRQMFATMYRSRDEADLASRAARVRAEARALHEHLWLRLGLAAA